MAEKKTPGYAQDIKHVEGTLPQPWPGIKGRSEDQENDLPTGTRRTDQADVTEAQRTLEQQVRADEEPTRE